ncbi:hypothetical protein Tfont_02299 [Tepidimonas fonticaldi]|uniref:Uncharacterized protein n=1 Tax=Tepidimonas fonticaldi TaxID=1101373 RepID=A0A554XHL2_9BURK|nr:hypothetical protein Tfont_02299 [Tepidimonas fonticaldi]
MDNPASLITDEELAADLAALVVKNDHQDWMT